MKIAMIAPIGIPIPPKLYGGTESIISILTDGLVDAGHQVTLFASAQSGTKAQELVETWPLPLVDDPDSKEGISRFIYSNSHIVGHVADRLSEFDLIHNHIDENALILSKFTTAPFVTTIHRKTDQGFQARVYEYYKDIHYIAISESQRSFIPKMNWLDTVYNGVDISAFSYNAQPDDYLLFLGRLSPEKDPVTAIKLAQASGRRLLIGAKLDPDDRAYFDEQVRPLLDAYPRAEFLGEVTAEQKTQLYQNAAALIFPIAWDEPFGLVMVEALAAGTPVIATRRGSVPEIIQDGISGYIRDDFAGLVEAIGQIEKLDRAACRKRAEYFSAERMVENYLKAYAKLGL